MATQHAAADGKGASMHADAGMQVNISLLVAGGDAETAVKALHKEFFEGTGSGDTGRIALGSLTVAAA